MGCDRLMANRIINLKQTGDFQKTEKLFHTFVEFRFAHKLRQYGEKGVRALSAATPKDSGLTAKSWEYHITETPGKTTIYWTNSHAEKNVNIAIILQYGHGTRNGGYVQGIDYINPALKPIFEQMLQDVWKEVVSL